MLITFIFRVIHNSTEYPLIENVFNEYQFHFSRYIGTDGPMRMLLSDAETSELEVLLVCNDKSRKEKKHTIRIATK